MLVAIDLAGTLIFAIEGANVGALAGLDVLGVLVLAFVTALAGGILRDLLIGAPPAAVRDWRYPAVAIGGGAIAFVLHVWRVPVASANLAYVDAAGLGLFAVAGAQKAIATGLHGFVATIVGGVTATGGGALRVSRERSRVQAGSRSVSLCECWR